MSENHTPFESKPEVIFPPQLSLDLLRNLLGEDGSKNEAIIKALKEII